MKAMSAAAASAVHTAILAIRSERSPDGVCDEAGAGAASITRTAGYPVPQERPPSALAGLLEHGGEIYDLTAGRPPAVFAPMAGGEVDLGAVRQGELDLNGVPGSALVTVDGLLGATTRSAYLHGFLLLTGWGYPSARSEDG
jgi:hypothetical protein